MKRIWTIFLLILLAAVPAVAASITVITPAANDNLVIGVNKPVTWTYAGLPNTTKIKIVLWRNGSNLGVIIQDLGIGQGSYDWKVGTYPVGPGYSVRVRTMDNSVSGFSGSFTLSDKPGNPPPLITLPIKMFPATGQPCMAVTSPKAGDSADPFNIVNVKWTKAAGLDPNVSITLRRTGKGAMLGGVTLAASTENDGHFGWDPTSLIPAPGVYRIHVKTLDGKCEAVSDEFTMNETGGIELLSPKGGEAWENGTFHNVTWKRWGNIQTVDILLNRTSSHYQTLAQGVDAKLGTKACAFERASWDQGAPCHYTLLLKQSGSGASGTANVSACFQITGNPDLAVSASFTPTLPNVGTNLTFTIKVENKGVVRSQPCQGDFYVNGAVDQAFPVPAIDPGATATVSRIWKLACPGTVKIIIDPGQVNVEPDKANNVWEKPICTN